MTTSTHQHAADDPMQAAMTAPEQDRHYFGIAMVDSYFCVLVKGQGKRPFDPTRDSMADRRIAIKLSIECDKRDGGRYTIDQEALNFEKLWTQFTLPSLQKLGIQDLRALNGAAVHVKRVATGETYVSKQDGQTKAKSAIVFLEIFPDTEAATAASEAFYGGKSGGGSSYAGMPDADVPQPPQSSMSPEQQFALNSLPALWKASGNDRVKFEALISQNPLISRHYPVSHPHVQALISSSIADDEGLPF